MTEQHPGHPTGPAQPPAPVANPGVGPGLARRLGAEFLGTALLVAVVVGSGIAAQRLSPDDVGLQLLENSIATAFGLTVLILAFGPLSGAHFNPVVSAADWLLGRLGRRGSGPGAGLSGVDVGAYTVAQVCGVGAAYWFTSSTSFANPAVTVGRVFSDTFAGIAPGSVPGFVAAQLVGAGIAVALVRWFYPDLGQPGDSTLDDVVVPHARTRPDTDRSAP